MVINLDEKSGRSNPRRSRASFCNISFASQGCAGHFPAVTTTMKRSKAAKAEYGSHGLLRAYSTYVQTSVKPH
jgi:hypothetical protein